MSCWSKPFGLDSVISFVDLLVLPTPVIAAYPNATDGQGRLLSLEVDGCEPRKGCKYILGKSDRQMADLLVAHGAWHAINLDGGGSSTTVENGTVIDRPTDTDHWAVKKERAVTTITCVL